MEAKRNVETVEDKQVFKPPEGITLRAYMRGP
jgi:hypothetical protein